MDVIIDPNATSAPQPDNSEADEFIGSRWNNRYTLTKFLGGGAFGLVYEASDDLFPTRPVAMKLGRSLMSKSQFILEARRISEIGHRNVVQVTDYGVENESFPFIVMELLGGDPVDQLLEKYDRQLPESMLIQFVDEISMALDAVHRNQLVHRDLKPNNIVYAKTREVDEFGNPLMRFVLLDFGIAGNTDPNASLSSKSLQGIGTLEYMSPEQAQNHESTPQTDIFSFGVVLYQLLTGRVPFPLTGNAPLQAFQVAQSIVNEPPPPLCEAAPDRDFKKGIEELLQECMAKLPEDRPKDMLEIRTRFRECYGLSGTISQNFIPPPPPPPTRPYLTLILGSLCLLMAVAVSVLGQRFFSAPKFAVDAEPVSIPAGESKDVVIAFSNGGKELPSVSVLDVPAGLGITEKIRKSESSHSTVRLPVSVEMNAVPGERKLHLAAEQGKFKKDFEATIIIEPAAAWIPPKKDFPITVKGPIVSIAGKPYYDSIIYTVPDEDPIRFILIDPTQLKAPGSRQPPFYIMENKVWNSLYEKFAKENGLPMNGLDSSRVTGGNWGKFPAMDMKPNDANRFALWLGGPHLQLPTSLQWWAAAGYFDKKIPDNYDNGPFRKLAGNDKETLKSLVGLPVGSSPRDISTHGIRDMAMNGKEWTSTTLLSKQRVVFPISDQDDTALLQVGPPILTDRLKLEEARPYFTDSLEDFPLSCPGNDSDPTCGFRLVLELSPMQ